MTRRHFRPARRGHAAPPARVLLRRLLLAGCVLLLPGLAACEPDQLGSAAIVEDTRISVSEIQGALETVRESQERLGVPAEQFPEAARNEIQRRIVVLIYVEAAERYGVRITDGEIATRMALLRQRAGSAEGFERRALADFKTLSAAEDDVRLELIEGKMAARLSAEAGRQLTQNELRERIGEKLSATARDLRIRINPRYGRFDPVNGDIEPYPFDYFRPDPGLAADG